jgi:hypothetical protein
MGFISLTTSGTNLSPSSTVQKVIHIFSFCAISFDILGVLSALTTAQNLLQIYSAMDQFLQVKTDVEGRMYQPLLDLQASGHAGGEAAGAGAGLDSKRAIENLIIETLNITHDLGTLDHEMERHANDNASALLIIFLGVICFFVALVTFIISSQPETVWIPTVVVVAVVIGIVLRNGNFHRTRRWDAIKLWGRGVFVSILRWINCKQSDDARD